MTERNIARMVEAELTSELMIIQMDGLQDKKKSIDRFYTNYDNEFPDQKRVESRFRATIDSITETFDTSLASTNFRRPPLFYSLFVAVYHRLYGVPRFKVSTPKKPLSKAERKSLRSAVARLSEILDLAQEDEPVPEQYVSFVNASNRQTDNIQPRRTRIQQIYRQAF